MKKLFRFSLLCLLCLLLLLGTESFSLSSQTNGLTEREIFSFAQTAPGVADVSLFGQEMTWNLKPIASLRSAFGAQLLALPGKMISAACGFVVRIYRTFA